MYLRTTQRRNANGSTVRHYQLAENTWDAAKGCAVARVIFNFGRADKPRDDYGRENLFEFDLAPGKYKVTVGAGRPAKGYPNDPHNVTIEGQKVIDDEITTTSAAAIERSATLDVTDGSLSLVSSGRSQKTGDYAYTFLAYSLIEPVE